MGNKYYAIDELRSLRNYYTAETDREYREFLSEEFLPYFDRYLKKIFENNLGLCHRQDVPNTDSPISEVCIFHTMREPLIC